MPRARHSATGRRSPSRCRRCRRACGRVMAKAPTSRAMRSLAARTVAARTSLLAATAVMMAAAAAAAAS
eukprot:4565264-Prymnesium_polylepis.1